MLTIPFKLYSKSKASFGLIKSKFTSANRSSTILVFKVGSFAAQTPGKVLDGLMIFIFKWALCYTAIYVGLDSIVNYIVQPLLDIGYSIGTEFNKSTGIGGV